MMSERKTTIGRRFEYDLEIEVGWGDLYRCALNLLAQTEPADVRWKHVERARRISDGIRALYEAKREAEQESSNA